MFGNNPNNFKCQKIKYVFPNQMQNRLAKFIAQIAEITDLFWMRDVL